MIPFNTKKQTIMNYRIETKKAVLITLLTVIVTIAALFVLSNVSLKKQLRNEQIRSESILSEKLLLDKNIAEIKADMASLKGKNYRLDKVLAQTSTKLINKEAELRRLLSERVSLAELKKKVSELEAIRIQLNNEIAALTAKSTMLLTENDVMNNKLAKLQHENNQLDSDNAILKAMVADNYRIEAVKGRHEKLTLIARKTDKLIVSFDLPSDVNDNISFKVLTPSGEEFSSTDYPSASLIIIDNTNNHNLPPSLIN